jgi:hypothetical protein
MPMEKSLTGRILILFSPRNHHLSSHAYSPSHNIIASNIWKDLKCVVVVRSVRSGLYLLSSHVSVLV